MPADLPGDEVVKVVSEDVTDLDYFVTNENGVPFGERRLFSFKYTVIRRDLRASLRR